MKQTQCCNQTGLLTKAIEDRMIDGSTAGTARLKLHTQLVPKLVLEQVLRVVTSASILVPVLELNVTPQVATSASLCRGQYTQNQY